MSKEELEKAADMAKQQMESLDPNMVDEAINAMKETSTGGAADTKPVPDGVAPGSSSDPVSAFVSLWNMQIQSTHTDESPSALRTSSMQCTKLAR